MTSDFFSRKDMVPGLGPAPQFMDAVFTAAEKSAPEMAATSQGFAVFQLLAVKPQSTPTFDEIRTRVEEEFKNERANVLLSQKTQELSDRAKAEHDLKKAAKELGATLKTSDFVVARWPGSRYRLDDRAGCGRFQHEAGRYQRADQQRSERRGD